MRFDSLAPGLPPHLGVLWGQIQDACRRLEELVSKMSQEELEYRGPVGKDNSTAALLAHLALSDLNYAKRFPGVEVPDSVAATFGPARDDAGMLPDVKGQPAAALLDRIRQAQAYQKQWVDRARDADLDTVVPIFRGNESSMRWLLWHVAGHSMLHQGHIRTLQRHWQERGK